MAHKPSSETLEVLKNFPPASLTGRRGIFSSLDFLGEEEDDEADLEERLHLLRHVNMKLASIKIEPSRFRGRNSFNQLRQYKPCRCQKTKSETLLPFRPLQEIPSKMKRCMCSLTHEGNATQKCPGSSCWIRHSCTSIKETEGTRRHMTKHVYENSELQKTGVADNKSKITSIISHPRVMYTWEVWFRHCTIQHQGQVCAYPCEVAIVLYLFTCPFTCLFFG